jgi:prepilin-type N-terminal cleavage/methylation domain-containing protein
MNKMKKGFTLVELIVVITVIGILATIVIVNYNGAQQKAQDAAVQSDLDGIAGQLEAQRLRNSPKEFPHSSATLTTLSIKATKEAYDTSVSKNLVYCVNSTDYQSYGLYALSKAGTVYMMSENGFKTTSVTKTNFSNDLTLCNNEGFGRVSSGMTSPNTWNSWVGN